MNKKKIVMRRLINLLALAAMAGVCLLSTGAKTASAYVEVEKHPIDIALEAKIDGDSSTQATIAAYEWATREWDKLMNANYNALMKKLDQEKRERLRVSQSQWIKYRDLEFAFNEDYWGGFDGTMHLPSPYAYRSNFVRERALRLGYYLEDLNE